jgi:hypothetical protein
VGPCTILIVLLQYESILSLCNHVTLTLLNCHVILQPLITSQYPCKSVVARSELWEVGRISQVYYSFALVSDVQCVVQCYVKGWWISTMGFFYKVHSAVYGTLNGTTHAFTYTWKSNS